ncbi:hypothetical protein OH76DRAFT_1561728 [Lentinus brumalis]|uniref:Uncharacterized protein n=1 Tax=Lentinus brumalis TaxID=2498619 RepID=A0A371CLL2_9APHY|nr:hypothetical protein OH76DRAFT_1561728 [Polyporus brumalis]
MFFASLQGSSASRPHGDDYAKPTWPDAATLHCQHLSELGSSPWRRHILDVNVDCGGPLRASTRLAPMNLAVNTFPQQTTVATPSDPAGIGALESSVYDPNLWHTLDARSQAPPPCRNDANASARVCPVSQVNRHHYMQPFDKIYNRVTRYADRRRQIPGVMRASSCVRQ